MASEQEIIEEELVYGALRRERLWQRLGLTGLVFGIIGCLSAAVVAILDVDPPPVVVPYDPATGFALPEASVGATSVTANQAIIEAEVFRYVTDREVYNQLDNDLRIRSVLRRSDGAAESGLRQLWNSANADYPPTVYGPNARLDVEILSITQIGLNRATVRLRKRLTSINGTQTGLFTATLLFEFRPETRRSIDEVWTNPFGFTGKDRSNNGGGGRNTGDADKHPKRLAQVDDVEKPAEKDPQHGQRRDDNAKRAG